MAELARREDFAQLAKLLSVCMHTKEAGGQIGWVDATIMPDIATDGVLPVAAKRALFGGGDLLRPGDVHVVESQLGWHVVKIEDVLVAMAPKGKRKQSPIDYSLEAYCRDRSYTIVTMGCQMNAADSERLEGALRGLGLKQAEDEAEADVVVLNTCSIREHAESKVYAQLGPHVKRKKSSSSSDTSPTLIVAGCVAQQEGERLARRVPELDIVLGPQYANRVAEVLERAVVWGEQVVATEPAVVAEDSHLKVRPHRASTVTAWVNVMYGCNERCTYCVVPATRGVQQSRTPELVLAELKELQAAGYQEATLLGQNVDAYGRDLPMPTLFADLLERAALAAPPGFRLRFVTSHPRYISERLVDVVASYPDTLMPVFHIPAQSGDDNMLRLMGRGYTIKRYLQVVDTIRRRIPDATITSDFIVGCPGESDDAFENTLKLMRTVEFDACMTAAYSPRPNTPMARFDGSDWAFRQLRVSLKRRNVREQVENNFKVLARRATEDQDHLRVLVEARTVARAALGRIERDPLFVFDPLAQIGPSQVDEDVKEDRLRRINALATEHALKRAQRHIGRLEAVLVEQRNTKRPHQVAGRTRTNKIVFFAGDIEELRGKIVTVNVTDALPFSLTGHLVHR